uniref:sulfhydryl oxidase 1-like n=1 Tax=Styela clava TaxID=7725 RepID=UPI00193A3CAB|nr:sulfhydryl oxidase 1-like [Styela clava]
MTAFTGLQVRRVSETNKNVLKLLKDFYEFELDDNSPTVLVLKDMASYTEWNVPEEEDARKFIRNKLQTLPGVKRVREKIVVERRNETKEAVDYEMPDVDRSKVYMHDLEVAIHYTLRKEVSGVEYIQGRYLQALKDFVAALIKYFPGRPPVMKFLTRINKSIKDLLVTNMLVWGTWQEILEKADETKGAYLTRNETYYGCSGSQPDLRGFPCSLWQLFHVLVNQAYKIEPEGEWGVGMLINMKEYIARYFSCMECRKHWAIATDDIEEIDGSEDSIMYLWSKHNKVNLRLSGGKNDDPEFPKVQWPTREICPECWNEHLEFDETKVFQFLVDFYSPANISEDFVEDVKPVPRPSDEL